MRHTTALCRLASLGAATPGLAILHGDHRDGPARDRFLVAAAVRPLTRFDAIACPRNGFSGVSELFTDGESRNEKAKPTTLSGKTC